MNTAQSGAEVSDCGQYRYRLWRRWGPGRVLVFVMLNPSTADASIDDATIRRCTAFARALGYSGIEVWNLYAFRATKPADLFKASNMIGEQDLCTYWAPLPEGSTVVCAWGAFARKEPVASRAREVWQVLKLRGLPICTLGLTGDNIPRHPLYLRGDAPLEEFKPC